MKTILIIDDDTKSTAALTIRLRSAGYQVLSATDGLSGLKTAIQHRPDLVVMDIWMPGGVGILIAQRLKRLGLADVPVIFLTAAKKNDLWDLAQEVDPAGFFEKPYDAKQILEAINLILAPPQGLPPRADLPQQAQRAALSQA
jgi:DNA-binding response OmpR family regulator